MRIDSPLRAVTEIAPLLEAGADCFYCGVQLPGEADINNRPNKARFNLPDMEAFREAAEIIHRAGKRVSAAVNKPSLDVERAVSFIREAAAAGADEVIVSSTALLYALREEKLPCRLSLSCTNPVFSSRTLDFFRRFGVSKVCLPRHLGLGEIRSISGRKGDVELEVFIMSGLCINVEAYCELSSCGGKGLEGDAEPCDFGWTVRGGRGASGLAPLLSSREWDCGLCALHPLLEMGVDSVKIVDRCDPVEEKVGYTRAVREMLDVLERERPSYEDYRRRARKYFADKAGPCRPVYCYY